MPISDYDYVELDGSGSGTAGAERESASRTRNYLVDWADLPGFVSALKGGGWAYDTGSGLYAFDPPHADPEDSTLFAQDISWDGAGEIGETAGGVILYSKAKVTAVYKPLKFGGTEPADAVEEELDFTFEQITLPPRSLKKTGGSAAADSVEEPVKLIVPMIAYTLTYLDLPRLPGGDVTLIMSMLAKVNDTSFKGAAVKKMLFMGANARGVTKEGGGGKRWRISYKFWYRPIEWTKVFIPKDGGFAEVEYVVGGQPLYGTGDLNTILPQDA